MMRASTLILSLLTILACAGAGYYAKKIWLPENLNQGLQDSLSPLPIRQSAFKIGKMTLQKNVVSFQRITLDPERFDTIDTITVNRPSTMAVFKPEELFQDIHIDGLTITRAWQNLELPKTVSVRQSKKLAIKPLPYNSLKLTNAQLDLASPIGGLTFKAEALYKKDQNLAETGGMNSYTLEGSLTSIQNQLRLESRVEGLFSAQGLTALGMEIDDFALNLPYMELKRINGWIAIERETVPEPFSLSGQLTAGIFRVGEIKLHNVVITISGDLSDWKILVKGQRFPSSANQVPVVIEIYSQGGLTNISAMLVSSSIKPLTDILRSLKKGMDYKPLSGDILTPLLITDGNLSRVEEISAKQDYHEYQLEIQGPLYDLRGKIIALLKGEDTTTKTVISLDPGRSSYE